jgi:DNA-binding CsgD family transcriptional regulator
MACVSYCNAVRPVDADWAWSSLWDGEWRVVGHVTGPSSHTIVCGPSPSGPPLLSREEIALAARWARGVPVKAIAADSGRSTPKVRELLAGVKHTLMLRSEAQFVFLLGGSTREDRSSESGVPAPEGLEATIEGDGPDARLLLRYRCASWRLPQTLSAAERSVVLDLLAGASRGDIALSRGTSQRTVANQMASIFRKLRVGSRIELLAVLRPSPVVPAGAASAAGRAGGAPAVREAAAPLW